MNIHIDSKNFKDLAKKVGISLLIVIIYLIALNIVTPGLKTQQLYSMKSLGLLQTLDLVSGGALSQASIVSLGVMPYIMAMIVVQILQNHISPTFTEWSMQGEIGQKKLKTATYILSIPFAILYAWGLVAGFAKPFLVSKSWQNQLFVMILWIISSLVLSYFADKLGEKGISNGISLIILIGIINRVPQTFDYLFYQTTQQNIILFIISLVIIGIILLFVTFIQESTYNEPIDYTSKYYDLKNQNQSFLPITINPSGVIPVIFASYLLSFITVIGQALHINSNVLKWFNSQTIQGLLFYGIFIAIFTYLYSIVQYNPERIAQSLQNSNGIIGGKPYGEETSTYLTDKLLRLDLFGSLFLIFICALPIIVSAFVNIPKSFVFSGTSILIMLSVANEIYGRFSSEFQGITHYKPFINWDGTTKDKYENELTKDIKNNHHAA